MAMHNRCSAVTCVMVFAGPNSQKGSLLLSTWLTWLVQVLLVNLVTSTTLGLALAAEPAEPTVMEQPPRRPNKRLVGKLLLWRMFFVCHVIVCLVLGMFAWAQASGYTLGQSRAEAFNILVGSQVSNNKAGTADGQGNRAANACSSAPAVLIDLRP